MAEITSTAVIKQFGQKGEKSGWQFIEVTQLQAEKLNPGKKRTFRVKGRLDQLELHQKALIPMGDGSFILPVNATMRKKLKKKAGDTVQVNIELDQSEYEMNADLMACLQDEPGAIEYFQSLPGSHQKYFSAWIDSAKTAPTIAKRIARAVNALSKKQGYSEMMREGKRF